MRSLLPPARRIALVLPAFALTAAVLTGCSATASEEPAASGSDSAVFSQELHDMLPEAIQESGVVSFGAVWETPPMISVDVDDSSTPVGIAPDLAVLLGDVLGVKAEWQNLQWPAQLPGVQAGNVDALLGQVSITAEREQSVVDLIPFKRTTISMLLSADDADGIERLDDLCGKSVAVAIGSNQGAYVDEASTRCESAGDAAIQKQEYQGASAAIQAIRAGSVDAWLNSTSDNDAAAKSDDSLVSVVVPEDEIATELAGIAVSKSQPGLTEALAGALKVIIENGSYDEVYASYDDPSSAITADDVVINPETGTPVGESAS